ncbi:MAG TPA: YfhO family protein [Chitinophagaceae bacterium]|nr:YfhO family protein [Chitinophagaceae bacterium]
MKKFNWKSLIPHAVAIGIFLVVATLYCKPVLQGKVLSQMDITQWTGMSHSAFEYKEKHGHLPLWNTHLFSGMPDYQVAMEGHAFLPNINAILTLGTPKPINFFFLACVCFYILCVVLRANSVVAILGSLAFAYCSYDPVIISVGHDSKMWAIAYMPALMAGLLLLYDKKYILGFLLMAVFATMEIGVNHPQINFYFAIIAFFVTVSYAIRWIKQKEWKHMLIAGSLALVAVGVGLANSSITLLTTAEYTKYTIRGGKLIDTNAKGEITQAKTKGLDEDYGFSYSAAKNEFLTFMMPDALGRSYGGAADLTFDENSKFVQTLENKGIPENNAANFGQSARMYWGGIFPSTSGPVYLGAIICILFIIGMVMVDSKYKWWIFAACVFAVVISWGKYFADFNRLLFEHLPLYNKFRAPSMAMVIPQFLFPLMAVLALQKIFFTDGGKALLQKNFKKILYAVGGVFVVLLLMYVANDYSSATDADVKSFADTKLGGIGSTLVYAMQQDRKSLFGTGILEALGFAVITIGIIYLFLKSSVKPVYLVLALLIVNTINLLYVDNNFLNEQSYQDDESYNADNFTPNAAEAEIMKDTGPHYRVLSVASDWTNEAQTAYFLRCIGGYHPAKLSIYEDLIENQIMKNNQSVLDMLDTKYIISPPQQQGQQYAAIPRSTNLGACWFVKEVKFVDGPVAEMKSLDNFNPAQTAFVENSFKADVPQQPGADSSASIKLVSYDNDDITYTSSSSTSQFAVLSEIYYPAGWNAYVDGKKVNYVKTDYVLRGLYLPAGKHNIEFKFEPESYNRGQEYTYIGNSMIWLAFLAFLWSVWNERKKKIKTAA